MLSGYEQGEGKDAGKHEWQHRSLDNPGRFPKLLEGTVQAHLPCGMHARPTGLCRVWSFDNASRAAPLQIDVDTVNGGMKLDTTFIVSAAPPTRQFMFPVLRLAVYLVFAIAYGGSLLLHNIWGCQCPTPVAGHPPPCVTLHHDACGLGKSQPAIAARRGHQHFSIRAA